MNYSIVKNEFSNPCYIKYRICILYTNAISGNSNCIVDLIKPWKSQQWLLYTIHVKENNTFTCQKKNIEFRKERETEREE